MATISLCMIVRDEEAMLPGCLASVAGSVDEVIIVDTGSRDRTMALARTATVVEQAWADDFSAPRNRSIAESSGDWVLVLDADERLTRSGGVALRQAVREDDFDCGLLPLHTATRVDAELDAVVRGQDRVAEACFVPRLMRRTPDLGFTGIVHEHVGEWLFSHQRRPKLLPGVDIVHLGGVPDARRNRAKTERNIRLLERACAQLPNDVTPYGYLAHEYLETGDRAKAREAADTGWRILESGVRTLDLSVLRLATARSWIEMTSGDRTAARATLAEAASIISDHPDLAFIRGCSFEIDALSCEHPDDRAQRLRDALGDYRHALACHGRPYLQKFVEGCTGWAAHVRIGTALLLLGDANQALAAFDRATALDPRAAEARWGRVEALLASGDSATALAEVQAWLDERPDGWVLAALAAESAGQHAQMATWIAKAQAVLAAGFVAPHRRERYHDALAALSCYLDRSAEVPGPIGQLARLSHGNYHEVKGARARALTGTLHAMARRIVRFLLTQGRGDRVRPLVDPRAELVLPGIVGLTRAVVDELGGERAAR